MDNYSFLNTAHTAYFADLYDQYLQDQELVILNPDPFSVNYGTDLLETGAHLGLNVGENYRRCEHP